jgi:cytochrome P450
MNYRLMVLNSRLLVRHPEVLKKLRAEISDVTTQNIPLTRDSLKKMTYLNNVLKESMFHFFL